MARDAAPSLAAAAPAPTPLPTPTPTPACGPPLLYRPGELAVVLGVSVRTLWRLDATARLPRAVQLGTTKRWRRGEVEAWIAAGCPRRDDWEAVAPPRARRG